MGALPRGLGSACARLLLIGDSQRARYQPVVARLLDGRAEVVGPAENCATSGFTLSKLPEWLAQLGRPDIVHWNNGLHDAGHNPERTPDQVPLETYLANLGAILALFRATGARVVWATSNPVHPQRPFDPARWFWRNEEIARYNAAAAELMRAEGVPVNDLHSLVASNPDLYIAADMLHLSPAGGEACGAAVVRAVEDWLPK